MITAAQLRAEAARHRRLADNYEGAAAVLERGEPKMTNRRGRPPVADSLPSRILAGAGQSTQIRSADIADLFGYQPSQIASAVSRLVRNGRLQRLAPGVFCLPPVEDAAP